MNTVPTEVKLSRTVPVQEQALRRRLKTRAFELYEVRGGAEPTAISVKNGSGPKGERRYAARS